LFLGFSAIRKVGSLGTRLDYDNFCIYTHAADIVACVFYVGFAGKEKDRAISSKAKAVSLLQEGPVEVMEGTCSSVPTRCGGGHCLRKAYQVWR